MNISTVNELIQSLESAGELSIKETKVMALAKAYQQLAAENVALKAFGDKLNEMYDDLNGEGEGWQGARRGGLPTSGAWGSNGGI